MKKVNCKLLLILILATTTLGLSSFRNKETALTMQKDKLEMTARTMNEIHAFDVYDNYFTDLNGVEYIDFLVEFHDEFGGVVNVTNLTVNYSINYSNGPVYHEYKVCNGWNYLLEGATLYNDPSSGVSVYYALEDGIGYQVY